MHLIVGLGNIGEKYQLTRHNIGFMVIDEITKNLTTSNIQKSNFHSTLEKSAYDLYSKPTTFMNNSGMAVQAIKEYYKLEMEDLIVIHDDIDLPFGTVKFKIGGGHGGHNGLRDIVPHTGPNFHRLRIGIGHPGSKERVSGHVLSKAPSSEQTLMDDALAHALGRIKLLVNGEVQQAMNQINAYKPN